MGENVFSLLIRNLHFTICEMDPKRTTSVFPLLKNAYMRTTTKKREVFIWECAIERVYCEEGVRML